ncbi:MAG: molybdopterin-dependent oxidoreductase [Coriobacteriia bacterium]
MSLSWNENVSPKRTTLEDGTEVTRTCAWSPPGCHAVGCGIKLFVKDGELVKVEGDPEHPLTRGRLCPRCLALKEYIYHPDRIIHPMKRDRSKRGRDAWEQISWDEATKLIVEKTNEVKEKYGPESIIVYSGTGREAVRYAFALTSQALGTPNHCYAQSGWSCMGPRQTAMTMLLGSAYLEYDWGGGLPKTWEDPDFVLPEYVLLWGKEPLKSNPDGLWGHALIELMKRGTKLLVVDPRRNWLTTRADQHLQLKPNTDGALALALLHIVINEGLVDDDFIEKWCYGYEELKDRVQQYTPEWAAEKTGLTAEEIVELARKLGYQKDGGPWGLCIGVATDQNPNGCQLVQALVSLTAITGYLDVPGGTVVGVPMQFDMNSDSPLPAELVNKCIGWEEYPILPVLLNTTHPDLTLEALETGKPYPVKMAWFDSSNLLSPTCSAQPKRWHDALRKMEFVVAKEAFMTPTVMALADVVLPISTWAEHDGIVMTNQGCQMGIVGALNKAMEVGECKSDLEIFLHFGKAMNPNFRWETPEQYLDNDLKGVGCTWGELSEKVAFTNDIGGYHKHERGLIRADGQVGFGTPTGRVELWSTGYANLGDDPLPYYEDTRLVEQRPDLAKEYPLTLTTGTRYYASFHSEHRQIPSLRQLTPDPLVEIHPETAEKLGIKDGDEVVIENPWGSIRQKALVTPVVRPDLVSAAHGWWFPEKDAEEPSLFGVWEANVNQLIPHKEIGKMGFGAPYKCLPCKVYKA